MGDLKLITTAYDGKCRKCRAGIRKGERVWWQKGTKGVLCIDCKADTAPVPSPAPITTSEPTTRVSSAHVPKGNYRTEVQGKRIVRIWDSWDAFVESSVLSANPHEFSGNS